MIETLYALSALLDLVLAIDGAYLTCSDVLGFGLLAAIFVLYATSPRAVEVPR